MTTSLQGRFSTLRHLRSASIIFIILFALTFYAGLSTGRSENPDAKAQPNEQFLSFGLTALFFPTLGFFLWFITGSVNDAVEEKLSQRRQELEQDFEDSKQRYGRLTDLYFNREGSKLQKILNSDIPESTKSELIEISERLQRFEDFFSLKDQAAAKLTKWLNKQENRIRLGDDLFHYVAVRYGISLEESEAHQFRQDLGKCILWMRDSIRILQGRKVSKEKLAQAALQGFYNSKFDPYEAAIRKMMLDSELASRSGSSNVLEDYGSELIAKLRQLF